MTVTINSKYGSPGSNAAPGVSLNSLVKLSDAAGNGITYDNVGLYVSKSDIGSYVGIDTFEYIIQPQNYATPVSAQGDRLIVGGKQFRKVYVGNTDETMFAYVLQKQETITCTNQSYTNANNATSGPVKIGSLVIPGDSLRWSSSAKITITVNLSGTVADTDLALGFSTLRNSTTYRVVKNSPIGTSGSSVTMELLVTPLYATKLSLAQVQSSTAPTSYPYSSQRISVNLLSGVEFPIYFTFKTPVGTPTVSVTSMTASIVISPPKLFQQQAGTSYRKAYNQPFTAADPYNQPLNSKVVVQPPVYTHNPASSGSNTSGTANAIGSAGSTTVTLYTTAGLKVGMRPCIVSVYDSVNAQPTKSVFTNALLTYQTFGADCRIASINSGTQITLTQPLVIALSQRGIESWGEIHGVAFFNSSETMDLRCGHDPNSTQIHPITGTTKTSYQSTAWALGLPVYRVQATDPIALWRPNTCLTPNGYLWKVDPTTTTSTGGEVITSNAFYMKTPVAMTNTDIAKRNNTDNDIIIVTEDGRYSIEAIGCQFSSGVQEWHMARLSVMDLNGTSVPYSLSSPEFIPTGDTQGIRAYGGGFLGGMVRAAELAILPDSSNTTETSAQIDANIAIAMNAIPHALAMLCSTTEEISVNYCPNPAVQGTRTNFYSYVSQYEKHIPAISAAGTGYAVGDVLYVGGVNPTDCTSPMRCTVTTVNGSGGVTGIFVSATGQYKVRPADASALATSTSGSGTGCVLNALASPDTTITTTSLAFPTFNQANAYQYPAIITDSAWNTQAAGCVPMGAWATLDQTRDLAAECKANRLSNPSALGNSYEMLAIRAAIQKYGIFNCDTSINSMVLVVGENTIPTAKWQFVTGDTGNGTMANLRSLKNELLLIDNVTPTGKGIGGTPKVSPILDLYPIAN